eukprot:gene19231-biopygen18479
MSGTAVQGANYDACKKLLHGGDCLVIYDTCPAGRSAPANRTQRILKLNCSAWDSSHRFQFDGSRVALCEDNTCDVPLGPIGDAAYDQCISKKSGQTCLPTCPVGYYANASIELTCTAVKIGGALRNVFDTQNAGCASHKCSRGPEPGSIHPSLGDADFSSCITSMSGSMCTPRCRIMATLVPVGGIKLICGKDVEFSVDGLACEVTQCQGGPEGPGGPAGPPAAAPGSPPPPGAEAPHSYHRRWAADYDALKGDHIKSAGMIAIIATTHLVRVCLAARRASMEGAPSREVARRTAVAALIGPIEEMRETLRIVMQFTAEGVETELHIDFRYHLLRMELLELIESVPQLVLQFVFIADRSSRHSSYVVVNTQSYALLVASPCVSAVSACIALLPSSPCSPDRRCAYPVATTARGIPRGYTVRALRNDDASQMS